jgi:hypothetical protein
MRITHNQLRRLIKEELRRLDEESSAPRAPRVPLGSSGPIDFMDDKIGQWWIKSADDGNVGKIQRKMGSRWLNDVVKKYPDAYLLFSAMVGFGRTNEITVERILNKRRRDLGTLVDEFDLMIKGLNEKSPWLINFIRKKFGLSEGNLVEWLRDDGMDRWADFVEKSLMRPIRRGGLEKKVSGTGWGGEEEPPSGGHTKVLP